MISGSVLYLALGKQPSLKVKQGVELRARRALSLLSRHSLIIINKRSGGPTLLSVSPVRVRESKRSRGKTNSWLGFARMLAVSTKIRARCTSYAMIRSLRPVFWVCPSCSTLEEFIY